MSETGLGCVKHSQGLSSRAPSVRPPQLSDEGELFGSCGGHVKAINAALADPRAKARIADLGGAVLPGSPADFGTLIADETEKWGKVVRGANIKPEGQPADRRTTRPQLEDFGLLAAGGLVTISGGPNNKVANRGYCNCCFTLSSPALTHSSSLPGEPDRPTPPITSFPTLMGTPPLIAITCGSVVCSRRTGRVFIS
jgi:hypothetical protein